MVLQIDLEKLSKNNLSPDEFVYMYCKKFSIDPTDYIKDIEVVIDNLLEGGWIKENPDSPSSFLIRPKFDAIFGFAKEKVEDWIEEWRNLFPNLKVNGYPIRGDKQGCLKKMKDFIKNNPEVTKDQIIEATNIYLFDKKKDNYKYIMLAHYFISKNGISILKAQIENLEEKRAEYEKFKDNGSAFHKEV